MSQWKVCTDERGRVFYENKTSGYTQWSMPRSMKASPAQVNDTSSAFAALAFGTRSTTVSTTMPSHVQNTFDYNDQFGTTRVKARAIPSITSASRERQNFVSGQKRWSKLWDESHQCYYYQNNISGKSQWENPFSTTAENYEYTSPVPEQPQKIEKVIDIPPPIPAMHAPPVKHPSKTVVIEKELFEVEKLEEADSRYNRTDAKEEALETLEEVDKLKKEIKSVEKENKRLHALIIEMQQRSENAEKELAKKNVSQQNSEISKLHLEQQNVLRLTEEKESIISNLEKEKLKLVKTQAKWEKAARVLKKKLKESEKNRDALSVEVKKLSSQIESERKENEPMKQQWMEAKNNAEKLQSKLTLLQSDFESKLQEASQKALSEVNEMKTRCQLAESNYEKEWKERRRLFNLVQELRGNIRVFLRVRPVVESELKSNSDVACSFPMEGSVEVVHAKKRRKKTWEFDHVYNMESTTTNIFEEIRPLVTSVMDGFNVCIFAYGQTGAGKTYTMEGNAQDEGIYWRALGHLFDLGVERSKNWNCEVRMSLLEIYNEKIRDLLTEAKDDLSIRVTKNEGNYVEGLSMPLVTSLSEVRNYMDIGRKNRSVGQTNMNEHSSRSHCMLSVYVVNTHKSAKRRTRAKLHLIDLAGSERLSKSKAVGERQKEARAINKSLSALGDVIHAKANKGGHVPYRNSTLTHLLQDSISGDSKVIMVSHCSPVQFNVDETYCTLEFAARARKVELGKATKQVENL
eukprot:g4640.t1